MLFLNLVCFIFRLGKLSLPGHNSTTLNIVFEWVLFVFKFSWNTLGNLFWVVKISFILSSIWRLVIEILHIITNILFAFKMLHNSINP